MTPITVPDTPTGDDPDSPDSHRRTLWRAPLLRADMEAAGVRTGELADALGVSMQVVSNWRRIGTIAPRYLPRVAAILGVPVERYLDPDAPHPDAPSAPRAPGARVLHVRAFAHAERPAAGTARQALEGGRRWLVPVTAAISAFAYAVEIPRGTVTPAGTYEGGAIVVDPVREPKPGALVLVASDAHGPSVRRYVRSEGRGFTVPMVGAGEPMPEAGAGLRLLGVIVEFHPPPAVL